MSPDLPLRPSSEVISGTLDGITRSQLLRPIEAIAFWSAVALPFLYLPLLVMGLETTAELMVFFGLVALNALAFVIGHRHKA